VEDRRRAGLWLALAGLNGAAGVVAGALGAHDVPPETQRLVETGAHFQLLHALALVGVALAMRTRGGRFVEWSGWAFLLGCLLFSGGLYLLAAGIGRAGILIPFGGIAFIVGWLLLAAAGLRDWRRPA
jgi:uncharacterized membrane protein YgdD (TMEM256/DUF423 family)